MTGRVLTLPEARAKARGVVTRPVKRWRPGTTTTQCLDGTVPGAIVIVLPLHLVSEANARGANHWAKTKRAAEQRGLATRLLPAYLREYRATHPAHLWLDEGGVTITLSRIAPRELDDDNIRSACKAVRDGIADAIGLKHDRDKRVSWEYAQERGAPRQYGVRVRVESRVAWAMARKAVA